MTARPWPTDLVFHREGKQLHISFDVGATFRDKLFPAYKGTREKMPDELSVQLGIGPVCGARDFGDAFKVMKKMAQAKLAGEPVEQVQNLDTMSDEDMKAELAKLEQELNA